MTVICANDNNLRRLITKEVPSRGCLAAFDAWISKYKLYKTCLGPYMVHYR